MPEFTSVFELSKLDAQIRDDNDTTNYGDEQTMLIGDVSGKGGGYKARGWMSVDLFSATTLSGPKLNETSVRSDSKLGAYVLVAAGADQACKAYALEGTGTAESPGAIESQLSWTSSRASLSEPDPFAWTGTSDARVDGPGSPGPDYIEEDFDSPTSTGWVDELCSLDALVDWALSDNNGLLEFALWMVEPLVTDSFAIATREHTTQDPPKITIVWDGEAPTFGEPFYGHRINGGGSLVRNFINSGRVR